MYIILLLHTCKSPKSVDGHEKFAECYVIILKAVSLILLSVLTYSMCSINVDIHIGQQCTCRIFFEIMQNYIVCLFVRRVLISIVYPTTCLFCVYQSIYLFEPNLQKLILLIFSADAIPPERTGCDSVKQQL